MDTSLPIKSRLEHLSSAKSSTESSIRAARRGQRTDIKALKSYLAHTKEDICYWSKQLRKTQQHAQQRAEITQAEQQSQQRQTNQLQQSHQLKMQQCRKRVSDLTQAHQRELDNLRSTLAAEREKRFHDCERRRLELITQLQSLQGTRARQVQNSLSDILRQLNHP